MNAKKLYYGILALLLLNGFTAFGQTEPSAAAEQEYKRAVKSLEQGDYADAQSRLEKAVELDSTHRESAVNLMQIYYLQKNYDGAERLASRLTRLQPEEADNWIVLGDIYKAKQDYDGLLNTFDQLIQLYPDSASYHYDKALTLTLKKSIDSALAEYNSIEEKFGPDGKLFIARRDIYLHKKDEKKALEEAEKYISFKPEESAPYLVLATTYLGLDKPKDALKILDKAERKFPADGYISLTKADAYVELKNSKKVAEELTKAYKKESLPIDVKIRTIYNVLQEIKRPASTEIAENLSKILVESHPKEASAHAVHGEMLAKSRKGEEAHKAFLQAIALDKQFDFIWEQLIQLEVGLEKWDEAQAHGLEAINLFPTNAPILYFTALSYLVEKKHAEARTFYEEALNHTDPEDQGLLLQIYASLGGVYNELEMYSASNVAFEEALEIDSNNTFVLNNFAYYLAERKEQLSKAERMSKKSNTLEPDNASYLDTYAWILFQQGKYSEALEWINKAFENLADDESNSTLIEHKGDILYKLGQKEEALKLWEKALKLSETSDSGKLSQKVTEKMYVE